MKLLIYGNRKQDDMIWDISTLEKENAAFLALFNYLNEYWEVYADVDGVEKVLFYKATTGDAAAAKALLLRRSNYEYETWYRAKTQN